MYIESYKNLIVWQKAIELVKEIYKVTEKLPKHEMYGLVSQMRRCAVSIPSNIAEGYKRNNLEEYIQFLSIADASAAELETQLILVRDLYSKLIFSKAEKLLLEIQKMLVVMVRKLKDKKLNAKRLTLNADGGQMMVEALVAITVAIVGLLGVFAFLSQSLGLNRTVADRYVATYLAAEGIEVVKNLADASPNWGDFINTVCAGEYEISYADLVLNCFTGKFLKLDPATGNYSYLLGEDTKFKRRIIVSEPQTGKELKVVSEVTWPARGGGELKVDLEDRFFNLTQ